MPKVIFSLGSNLGDRNKNLSQAILQIKDKIGEIVSISSIYETEPWGVDNPQWFFNLVLIVDTRLNPYEILEIIMNIELKLGRIRTDELYAARKIDIDILFYDSIIIKDESLIIPHQYLHLRKFVLLPLTEVAPNFIHPLFGENSVCLLAHCNDKLVVKLVTN
jgi:2-amino-4-hydroxy-6-hydroxymethyldihydropteridine diphosphokinase